MFGQIILAWYLVPDDFGQLGLALTVTAFASLLQNAGIREILIHRQKRFASWANPAFWMSAFTGLLAGGFIVAVAPVAAAAYHNPQLVGLLLLFALSPPLFALAVVPDAQLQIQLRFRALAIVNIVLNIAQTATLVLLAWRGFGAYSFPLAPLAVLPARVAVTMWMARPPIRLSPQLRRWRYLLKDSSRLLLSGALLALTTQGDYLILGRLYDTATVGVYVFAFNLSTQVLVLLMSNLSGVLFPALSQLRNDPPRQLRAFRRAAQALVVVATPLCLLQAAVADPLLRLLFGDKWLAAIPILQVLSVAIAAGILNGPSFNLLQARGRFGTVLWLSVLAAAMAFAGWIPGALLGKGLGLACGGLTACAITSFIVLTQAVAAAGGSRRDVFSALAGPVVAAVGMGIIVYAGGTAAGLLLPGRGGYLLHLTASGLLSLTYLPLLGWVAPEAAAEWTGRLDAIAKARPQLRFISAAVGRLVTLK